MRRPTSPSTKSSDKLDLAWVEVQGGPSVLF